MFSKRKKNVLIISYCVRLIMLLSGQIIQSSGMDCEAEGVDPMLTEVLETEERRGGNECDDFIVDKFGVISSAKHTLCAL